MSDKKIIAVVGATGAQGGGLVRAILADPNGPYVARAIPRKANSGRRHWPNWGPKSSRPISTPKRACQGRSTRTAYS
jgi:hypothetical protein